MLVVFIFEAFFVVGVSGFESCCSHTNILGLLLVLHSCLIYNVLFKALVLEWTLSRYSAIALFFVFSFFL